MRARQSERCCSSARARGTPCEREFLSGERERPSPLTEEKEKKMSGDDEPRAQILFFAGDDEALIQSIALSGSGAAPRDLLGTTE